MALNSINKEALSFKKLFGKAHTQFSFGIVNEAISSNIQIASSTIFADPLDPLPATNGGLVTTGDTDSVVEKVRFEIEILPDTTIGTNQSQGYYLKLPAGYNGVLSGEFSGGSRLYEALGKLQIVPKLYGTLKADGTTEYDPVLYQTDGTTVISTLSEINWNLDPYNGILFVQNPPVIYDTLPARPKFLEAYLYVGDYLNVGGTGGSGSGERIEKEILQINHGFAVGDVLSTSGGTYIKALAQQEEPEALGIVTVTGGSDVFTLTYAGYTEAINLMSDVNGNPLSGDTIYYLSDTLEGKLTSVEPVSVDDVRKPMIYIIESGTSGNIFQVRGDLVDSGSTSGGDTNVQVVNSGGGIEVGITPNAGDTVELRTLVGSGDTIITQDGDQIIISSSSTFDSRDTIITNSTSISINNNQGDTTYIASGTTTYQLPSNPLTGLNFTFSDGIGNAGNGIDEITINGNGNNILDDTFALINTNYGSITMEFNGVYWTITSFVA